MKIFLYVITKKVKNEMIDLPNWLRLRIAFQTMKDYFKMTIIITFLFICMAAMFCGMFPAFEESLIEMTKTGLIDNYTFLRGSEDMATYIGFLNLELYQMFYVLILGILVGFISASIISKEIESKTIDILMSNPISRKQIIFEKFIGLIPMILIINIGMFIAVYGTTIAIGEEINLGYLFLTHVVSIPYFLAVISSGLITSVIINEKMKASIITVSIIIAMFIFQSISQMIPKYENIGLISITHYFNPYDTLKSGEIDGVGILILTVIAIQVLIASMIYFEHRDINVS